MANPSGPAAAATVVIATQASPRRMWGPSAGAESGEGVMVRVGAAARRRPAKAVFAGRWATGYEPPETGGRTAISSSSRTVSSGNAG